MTLPSRTVQAQDCQRNWEDVDPRLVAVEADVAALEAADPVYSPTALVTSLPGSPTDGQIIYYDTGTDGVVWQFRYDAASASSYKWQFIGGASLYAEVTTAEGTSSATFTDLATAGPTITLPSLAGDFTIRWGATTSAGAVNGDAYFGLRIAGSDPAGVGVGDDVISVGGTNQPASMNNVHVRARRKTGLASASEVKVRYRGGSGITTTFSRRWIEITPVRVG